MLWVGGWGGWGPSAGDSRRFFLGKAAKDFCPSRKYAREDVGTNKGAGMANDEQSSLIVVLKQRDRSAWSAAFDRHMNRGLRVRFPPCWRQPGRRGRPEPGDLA